MELAKKLSSEGRGVICVEIEVGRDEVSGEFRVSYGDDAIELWDTSVDIEFSMKNGETNITLSKGRDVIVINRNDKWFHNKDDLKELYKSLDSIPKVEEYYNYITTFINFITERRSLLS
jgi:hypothetical protein